MQTIQQTTPYNIATVAKTHRHSVHFVGDLQMHDSIAKILGDSYDVTSRQLDMNFSQIENYPIPELILIDLDNKFEWITVVLKNFNESDQYSNLPIIGISAQKNL